MKLPRLTSTAVAAKAKPKQAQLEGDAARTRNREVVEAALKRVKDVENKLAAAEAVLPAMRRNVTQAREDIEGVMNGREAP